MKIERAYLGEVHIDTPEQPVPVIEDDFTNIAEYSEFKYGNGEVSEKYGRLLGQLATKELAILQANSDVLVASSAFRLAPPASYSLVGPFLESLHTFSETSSHTLLLFKISKTRLAASNYAHMSLEERSRTIQHDLSLPSSLEMAGKHVVILDDIRVTGLREKALTGLLSRSGVAEATFLYVLNTIDGEVHPETEAALNTASIKGLDDIIALANKPLFIPNVRLCKFLAAQTIDELERFCSSVPDEVAQKVAHYIQAENLREVIKYVP